MSFIKSVGKWLASIIDEFFTGTNSLGTFIKELVLILLLLVVLVLTNQVTHFYSAMFDFFQVEDDGMDILKSVVGIGVHTISVFVATFFLTYVLWHVPADFGWDKVKLEVVEHNYRSFASRQQGFLINFLVSLPMFFVSLGMAVAFAEKYSKADNIPIINVIFFILAYYFVCRYIQRKKTSLLINRSALKGTYLIFIGINIAALWLIGLFVNLHESDTNSSFAGILYTVCVLTIVVTAFYNAFTVFSTFFYWSDAIHRYQRFTRLPSDDSSRLYLRFPFFRRMRSLLAQKKRLTYWTLGVSIFFYLSIYFFPEWWHWMNPIFIIIFILAFYFFIWDVFLRNAPMILYPVTVLLILLGIISNQQGDTSKYDTVPVAEGADFKDRISFSDWTEARIMAQLDTNDFENNRFYLVAGEGGGSKSGAWFSSVLHAIQSQDSTFWDRTLLVSTVSGSSTGMNLLVSTDLPNRNLQEDALVEIGNMYNHNYITPALACVLTRDLIKIPWLQRQLRNRNQILQLQESKNTNRERSQYSAPFLSLYYQNKKMHPHHPLFMPNTIRVNDGKRGIVSPVTLEEFPGAVDVLKLVEQTHSGRTLSMGQSTLLSQAFPYLNNSPHYDSVGTFLDGGAFENRGLTTIHDAYNALEATISTLRSNSIPNSKQDSALQRIKFIMIVIYKTHVLNKTSYKEQVPTISATPIGAINSLFNGHVNYMEERMKMKIKGTKHKLVEFYIEEEKNGDHKPTLFDLLKNPLVYSRAVKPITMSRWLSAQEVKDMYQRARASVDATKTLLELR